jgi:hypothetical protein
VIIPAVVADPDVKLAFALSVANVVPLNVSALPLVATLLAFRYKTPLAVPPFSVRLPERVAVPALTEAMDAPVTVKPVTTAVPTLAEAMLAEVDVRLVTVPVVISATAALAEATDAEVAVRLVIVPVVITAVPTFAEAMEAPVAVRLVITATPALMLAMEAAVN